MKTSPLISGAYGIKQVLRAAILWAAGCFACQSGYAAPLIDLSKPVSASVPAPTGIYWTSDSIAPGTPYNTTADSSANGYNGFLLEGRGGVSSIGGVNLPGTAGYGNGIRLSDASSAPGGDGNPKVLVNLPEGNQLQMVGTDFTGGLWLNFNSVLPGAQSVSLMNRGAWGAQMGHWGLNLSKDASNQWGMIFQVANGSAVETVQIDIPVEMAISTGTWNHIGFSYRFGAGSADNEVTFWMNGVNLGSRLLDVDIAADTGSTRRFVVGEKTTTTFTSVFDGTVDDVFVTTGLYAFQAVPEPGTHAMLLLGAGVFFVMIRRRLKRA